MTANWPKPLDDNQNKVNDGSVIDADEDEEDDEDELKYNFYYKSNSSSSNTLIDSANFISLKIADENTLETVLPGVNGVNISSI